MRFSPHLVLLLLLIALTLVGGRCDVRASYGNPPRPSPEPEEGEGPSGTDGGFRLVVRVGDPLPSASAVRAAPAAEPASPSPELPHVGAAVPLAGPASWVAGLLGALLGTRWLSRRPVP